MKYIFFAILVSLFLFPACKKSPNTQTNLVVTPPAGSTGDPIITSTVVPTATSSSSFHGSLTSWSSLSLLPGFTFSSSGASAYFSKTAAPNINSFNFVKVNSVYFNRDSLISGYGDLSYSSVPGKNLNLSTTNWIVNGANGINSFSCTNIAPYPSCSNFNVIEDSVSKSTGATLLLEKVKNISDGTVFLYDLSGGNRDPIVKPLAAGDNVIVFSPADLASYTVGSSSALFMIIIASWHEGNVSGKNFRFSKEVRFSKQIKINK